MKKLLIIPMLLLTLLSSSSVTFADTENNHVDNNTIVHTHYDDSEEYADRSVTGVMTVVKLSAWMSHRNYHTSYTKTVVRQGQKYTVKYEAAPRSSCWYCKFKSY